jgi:LmbE family N-acetylglucosaminyl deacetylase
VADRFEEIPASVLAVFAHPDDPEVACGGTLHRWALAGADVRVLVANRGDKGSSDPTQDPDELAEQRALEVAAALDAMGVPSWASLGIDDGETENTSELRGVLVSEIRDHRPDVVIAPDPTAAFFGDTYVNHRDHRSLGWAVVDAVAPAAASPLYYPEAGDAHQVATLLLAGSLEPDVWVDISDAVEVKVAAVHCHSSQVGDPVFVAEAVRQRAADVGGQVGVDAAEMFRRLRLG